MRKKIKIFILIAVLLFIAKPFSAFAFSINAYQPTDVTDNSATLHGNWNASSGGGSNHDMWWEWNYENFGNNDSKMIPTDCNLSGPEGEYSCAFQIPHPDTSYWYRFCVKRDGSRCSSTVQFSSLPAPTAPTLVAETVSPGDIQSKSVMVKGSFSSNRRPASIWFEYGEATMSGGQSTCPENSFYPTIPIVKGAFESGPISQNITGLTPQTTYCFRLSASNGIGGDSNHNTHSTIQTFTTGSTSLLSFNSTSQTQDTSDTLPTPSLFVSTKGVINLTSTSATLTGSVIASPNNRTTAYFRFSTMPIPPVFCNELYGGNMAATGDINVERNGGAEQIITAPVSNLIPDTTYYYCAIASTKKNVAYGNNQTAFSFTTPPCDEIGCATIKTEKATAITSNTATLNAFYNSTKPITVWFQYLLNSNNNTTNSATASSIVASNLKTTASKSMKTMTKTFPAGNGPVSIQISGLQTGKTYSYWAIAKTDGPETKGDTFTFKARPIGGTISCGPNTAPNIYNLTPEANAPVYNSLLSTSSGQGPLATNWQSGLGPIGIPYVGSISTQGNISNNINATTLQSAPTTNGCTGTTGFSTTTGIPCSIASTIPIGCLSKSGFNTLTGQPCAFTLSSTPQSSLSTTSKKTFSLLTTGQAQIDNINQLFDGVLPSNSLPQAAIATPNIYPAQAQAVTAGPRPTLGYLDSVSFSSNPCDPININPHNNSSSSSSGQAPLTLGQTATPPVDATVHQAEGIETVLARQIIAKQETASAYGYDQGTNLQAFAWNLADVLARSFGYVNSAGKEIRVSKPDVAAYEIRLEGGKITIYEYYNKKIVNIQKMSSAVRSNYYYEYYYNKKK
jgi:hypothetical protein